MSLMIQGTSSGSGKTTLVTALCRIFADKGYSVAPFKSQNMSNYAYKNKEFEISRAQAIQAIAARTNIIPEMNPILLKPLGNYYSDVFLLGKKFKKIHASDYYSKFVMSKGYEFATNALKKLQKNHDLVILEGAGSPAEINLMKFDIANMKIAQYSKSPVVLISDIDRGGAFASIVGTLALLEQKHQNLIKGFVFNKFRGNVEILKPGFKKLKQKTGRSVLGTIPMAKINIPEEDSLGVKPRSISWNKRNLALLDKEIDKLAQLIKQNLNIHAIEKIVS